ncbi:NAD/NADP octopine/nopaline dehydrogenase family protein [Carboxylicivirga sp. N1Y90]|uniref:NAD/NADP octopine/nopaline dehydrogenase family protein n=1 Tax=Carboxylicivirga fragile TaxID=3417571 RepID=UPI003D3409DA|nr:NAD/NADP octopine/nopaline dehydrogenase family protein [Marinilabiliaceae bacterium N1Y90]
MINQEVCIVGGGSSAHILIPFLSKAGFKVNILTRRPEEWSANVDLQLQSINGELEEEFKGELIKISDNPAEVIPQADFVILCMPVCKYRIALHNLAPHLSNDKEVFVGTIYGQAGFNWMVDEIKNKFDLATITTFAIGLIPWICRIIEYGKVGVTYGCKEVNVVAVSPPERFDDLNERFLKNICERWLKKGAFKLADNFLSLTLSVDNQIIHPSRCYGLFLKCEGKWANKEDIPYFYRDYDQKSADLLQALDADYSKVREAIKLKYPEHNFTYMLDYLSLERVTYESENTDIRVSFTTSETLGAIKPPTVQLENGAWVIDKDHRFFTDDIHYGLCIAKWMADQLNLEVPTIDSIITWAQELRNERIIDGDTLILDSESLTKEFMSGIPPLYGYQSIDDILD